MKNIKNNITLIKYFLSYFIIASILFFGFFFSVRYNLKHIYFENLREQTAKRLSAVQEELNNNLYSVNQIHSLLVRDIDLVLSRNTNDNWSLYEAALKLQQYTIGNDFISSICYIDFVHNTILSSGKHVRQHEGAYEIYTGSYYLPFPIEDYIRSGKSHLLHLYDGKSQLLLYLPYNNGITSYSIFYIIDETELQRVLETGLFPGVSAIALFDADKQYVSGINAEALLAQTADETRTQSSHFLSLTDLIDNYSIHALLSDDTIISQVNMAFRNTYLLLVLLAGLGILLILWAMRITYWPLHKLTRKLIPTPSASMGYVDQLDTAFQTVHTQNQQLQEKIQTYRLSMQKSILDNILSKNNQANSKQSFDIDQLFRSEGDSSLFVVKVRCSKKKLDFSRNVKQFLDEALPGTNACLLLEANKNEATFIVQYSGMEGNKEDVLQMLMTDLWEEGEYLSAISNSALSPLEIPSLYENAKTASKLWTKEPVVSYCSDMHASVTNDYVYPYQKLEAFIVELKAQNISGAKLLAAELLSLIDKASSAENALPDFFIRCVLIDILSGIINSMNRLNIRFKVYSDVYFEALYLCRSCSYTEKRQEIEEHIAQLLTIYEAECNNITIHSSQIKEIILGSYTSPDFSISSLADNFNISIAYMSYLFKKKFDQNFSDYLWSLRLEKAKELLLKSDLTIDAISIAVGYFNTSSFRRKFKQDTGVTPSQFRGAT